MFCKLGYVHLISDFFFKLRGFTQDDSSANEKAALMRTSIEKRNIDYFIKSATYGFLFTSCKTLENSLVRCAHSFVVQSRETSV